MWLFFTHTTNFCLHYLWWFQVSIHLGNWSHVLNYVNKAENTSELAEVKIKKKKKLNWEFNVLPK